jgi:FtsZ-interacting cell division protein ZipA
MVLLVIVGAVTIIGVVVIAAIETRRMEKGQPSIISSKKRDKAEEES